MSTHETDTGPVTLINVFEIEPDKLESFLAGWRHRAAFMSEQPGFRSLRLHRALSPDSRFQLVNVAEWERADALRAATAQDTFKASTSRAVSEFGAIAHPGVYRVAFEVTVPRSKDIRPPWWLKVFNRVYIRMSRVGVSLGANGPAVLTVPGRKSGKPRSTPVTPITVDGARYVVQGVPGSDWVANARAAGQATLRRGRSTAQVRMIELAANDARPVLREYPIQVPIGVGFVKKAGLLTEGTPDEFEELAGRCAVFRLEPRGDDAMPARGNGQP
jgi:deazaflavin-dependent oxidoreductase (nitroreductase family)